MQNQTRSSPSAARPAPGPLGNVTASIELPPLPYGFAALEPVISQNTLHMHYGKHNKGYVDELNKLIAGTEFSGMSLEQIMHATAHKPASEAVYNNAAQAWNHAFYWRSLKPQGGGDATRTLQPLIKSAFGDMAALKRELGAAAASQFGSGWAWLSYDGTRLKVVKTGNAGSVLVDGLVPLLVIDVWEHAYYLDYQNRRADYVAGVLDKLLNWEFAEINLRNV
jgi:Fe-Mn family superoxide dismutase